MKFSKLLLLSMCVVTFLFVAKLVDAKEEHAIQIKGSDTMVNLGQAWAEEFMMKNPQANIAVTGGGSGTGIAALINGTCDIAEASRAMKLQEWDAAKDKGLNVKEIEVGIDAIAVIVHPSNPVKQLTIEQLSDIFTGKIQNWKEVGGDDKKILTLSRDRNSGTHIYFLEHVLRKGNEKGPEQFAPQVLMMPSSQAIVDEVSHSESAVGYTGLGYLSEKVTPIGVAKNSGEAYVLPTLNTAMDKTYPIARALFFYTAQEPAGIIKTFIDYTLSDEGQAVVETMGFVPLKK